MKSQFTVPEHVIERTLGDKTILLSLRSGDYFSLNAVGSFFWKGLSEGREARELAEEAARTYGQPLETIEHYFTRGEIEAELAGAGFRMVHYSTVDYAHAVGVLE